MGELGESRRSRAFLGEAASSWPRRYRRTLVSAVVVMLALVLVYKLAWRNARAESLPLFRPAMVHVDTLPSAYMDTFRAEGNVSYIPDADALRAMTGRQRERLYYSYLDNVDFLCYRKLRMGNVGDGGWEVCDDQAYRPVAPCIVYSFGISNDFSFDDAIARTYGCHVYAFDPSMRTESHNRSQLVHYYNLGVGGEDMVNKDGWTLRTLGSLVAMLGHAGKTLDVLKMDVEMAEWQAVPEMAASGSLRSIRQLYLEFHAGLGPDDKTLVQKLLAVRAVQQAGFKRFHSHKNPNCGTKSPVFPGAVTICYEVYFLNPGLARTRAHN